MISGALQICVSWSHDYKVVFVFKCRLNAGTNSVFLILVSFHLDHVVAWVQHSSMTLCIEVVMDL